MFVHQKDKMNWNVSFPTKTQHCRPNGKPNKKKINQSVMFILEMSECENVNTFKNNHH